ncbi:MAG: glyoxalase [Pseudopedobacter sp.]|nr:glyoxalase [Deinococcales bacterium]
MITGLDHVLVTAPKGHEGEARAFFGEFLGMTELQKPEKLAVLSGVWFGMPDGRQLHTLTSEPFSASKRARLCLRVRDLDLFAEMAENEGYLLEWDGRAEVRRVFMADPWGNRLEIVEGSHVGVALED